MYSKFNCFYWDFFWFHFNCLLQLDFNRIFLGFLSYRYISSLLNVGLRKKFAKSDFIFTTIVITWITSTTLCTSNAIISGSGPKVQFIMGYAIGFTSAKSEDWDFTISIKKWRIPSLNYNSHTADTEWFYSSLQREGHRFKSIILSEMACSQCGLYDTPTIKFDFKKMNFFVFLMWWLCVYKNLKKIIVGMNWYPTKSWIVIKLT